MANLVLHPPAARAPSAALVKVNPPKARTWAKTQAKICSAAALPFAQIPRL